MKLLVDLTYVKNEYYAGITVYAFRLLNGLLRYNNEVEFDILATSENKVFIKKQFPSIKIQQLSSSPSHPIVRHIPYMTNKSQKLQLENIIRENAYDLLFSPYINAGSLVSEMICHIGVMHDAQQYEIFKKRNLLFYNLFKYHMNNVLKGVTHIVTISEASKKSIIEQTNVDPDKILVIPNSIQETQINPKVQITCNYPVPYILNINSFDQYKNTLTLIKAFETLANDIPHKLILKGNNTPYYNDVIKPYIHNSPLNNRIIVITEQLSSDEIDSLYRNASLFVSPSLMEGFGYTPIEAAIRKIPVIISDIETLKEISMGKLYIYSPATDYVSLSHVIRSTLEKRHTKKDLSHISDCFKVEYSLQKQCERFVTMFKKILNEKIIDKNQRNSRQ